MMPMGISSISCHLLHLSEYSVSSTLNYYSYYFRHNIAQFIFWSCQKPTHRLLSRRIHINTFQVDTAPVKSLCRLKHLNRVSHALHQHGNVIVKSQSYVNIQKFHHLSGILRNQDNKYIVSDQVASLFETSHEGTLLSLSKDMLVYNDFVSEEEEESLLSEIGPYMKKLRYEYDHWDDAIHGYRETEKKNWNDANQKILQRVRELAFPPDVPSVQLAYVHILDLEKTGYIKPHIDSIRFCGSTITGLSLLSDTVMRLENVQNKDSWAKILLKRRSLYIMKGIARYQYTHAVMPDEHSTFKQQRIPRERRISIICRNEAPDLDDTTPPDTNSAKRY